MVEHWYPFFAAFVAWAFAQGSKPIFYYLTHRKWVPQMAGASGGFPSSHSATAVALAISTGFRESWNSTLFAVTLVLSLVIIYDAANVRYYSGQNIQLTQQLIRDLKKELPEMDMDDPIYFAKMKNVLGHKWTEVWGGIIVGAVVSIVMYYCWIA